MTLVKGDSKALFSIATTMRCRGARYSFLCIAPLYPWLQCWVLIKAASSTNFLVFGMTWTGIEPRSPGPLEHTLLIRLIYIYIYIYIYISSSLSSCRAISTDIPDSPSPRLPIVHCFRQILRATSRISTKLLYVGSCWMSCLCSSMVHRSTSLTSSSLLFQLCPACLVRLILIVFIMGGRWPYKLLLSRVLFPGLVQYCSQYSCVIAVKLFLHPFSYRPCGASI